MNIHTLIRRTALLTLGGLFLFLHLHTAQAGHVYGGITDTNGSGTLDAGDALAFINTVATIGGNPNPDLGTAISGSSLGTLGMSLVTNPENVQAGLFSLASPSFTGLSNGSNWRGSAYRAASPFAALSGTRIQLKITSITGPAGAKFSFWDTGVNASAPAEIYTIGSSTGTGFWDLTDPSLVIGDGKTPPSTTTTNAVSLNEATPFGDPYGHIHGRSFTTDTEGTYNVSFMLRDANGIQDDSQPFELTYAAAVPEPGTLALLGGAAAFALVMFLRRNRRNAAGR